MQCGFVQIATEKRQHENQHRQDMRTTNITDNDGNAIAILAAKRMGLEPKFDFSAKWWLVHMRAKPMDSLAMEAEVIRLKEQIGHDSNLSVVFKIHIEHLRVEYGFSEEISKEAFMALQNEAVGLELTQSRVEEFPYQFLHVSQRLKVIAKTMEKVQWAPHPELGCVLKQDAIAMDRAGMRSG
jgi:hypothetical protein